MVEGRMDLQDDGQKVTSNFYTKSEDIFPNPIADILTL